MPLKREGVILTVLAAGVDLCSADLVLPTRQPLQEGVIRTKTVANARSLFAPAST